MSVSFNPDPVHGLLCELLTCQVCWETASAPMYRCRNEHLLCVDCIENVHNCPTCRVPITRKTRCRTLEKVAEIVRYPCAHSQYGCPESLPLAAKEEHERRCGFRESARDATCPLVYTCPWTGSIGHVEVHVRQQHTCEVMREPAGRFEVSSGTYCVVEFDGELFCVRAESTQQAGFTAHYLHVGRVSQGSRAADASYLYHAAAKSGTAEIRGVVGNYRQPLDELAAAGSCLFFVGPSGEDIKPVLYTVTIARLT